ncbi:MAG TPA: tetratricopeptide repeat protein, partial [bacterium]
MPYYERAIALNPHDAQAHCNLGLTLLHLGDYPRGFAEYEWRWQTGQCRPWRCPQPRWDGRPIPDHTLLLHTEQGAGDAIQCARYLPLVAQRCGKLLLACRPDLIPLLATVPGLAEIRDPGTINVAEFDTYLPLGSVPLVLGTTLATIPAAVPYLDVAALRRRQDPPAWPRLEPSPRPRVGVVWAGSPTDPPDRQRSCALRDVAAVLQLPGLEFYSLQPGEPRQELAQLPPQCPVRDLAPA